MMFDDGGSSSEEEEEWDSRRDLAAAVGMDITAAAMPVRLRVLVVLDIMVLVLPVRGAMSAAVFVAAAMHSRRICVDDWSVEVMVHHFP